MHPVASTPVEEADVDGWRSHIVMGKQAPNTPERGVIHPLDLTIERNRRAAQRAEGPQTLRDLFTPD